MQATYSIHGKNKFTPEGMHGIQPTADSLTSGGAQRNTPRQRLQIASGARQEFAMHLVWTLLIGLLVGVVAEFLMPGNDPGGLVITILLGIAGSFAAMSLGRTPGLYGEGAAGRVRHVSCRRHAITAAVPRLSQGYVGPPLLRRPWSFWRCGSAGQEMTGVWILTLGDRVRVVA